jgi:hypothetical protein
MPRKRPRPFEEAQCTFFYLDQIPHVPEYEKDLDMMWNYATTDPADVDGLLIHGIGRLLVWCNVVGLPIVDIFRCPFGGSSSLVLHVVDNPERVEKELVGDHQNWDKKTRCTTLLRMTYKYESELLAAGKY